MRLRFFVPMAAIAAASMMVAPEARACGGCFQQQDATVVTGHRMVLSISPTQTVLWDQFQYTGDPKDFAWVLPVRAGAYIETSTDAWFETLDAATTATVLSPQIACPSSGGGFGCGAALEAASDGRGGNQTGVIVLHEGTVGPYETVTLKATQPGALNNWLTQNGYKIDPTTQPIIDAYVNEGFDFIALRLAPNAGVRQMKPVRVLSQGADPSLPLRMVAAGTGAQVAFTLFTISEARYETKNFANALTPRDLLLWNFETNKSNYADLRLGLMAKNEGETWLTVYAKPRALLSTVNSPELFGPVGYTSEKGEFFQTIAEAYVARGRDNGESSDTSCTSAFGQVAESGDVVVNPCPFGAKADDPACGTAGANEIDSRSLACGALDDLAVALRGLHPQDVWLTRLEANLPRAALGKDLSLTPASDQLPVDNFMTAKVHIGSPCPSALPAVGTGGGGQDRGRSFPVGLAVGALLFGAALARRTRSRGRLITA